MTHAMQLWLEKQSICDVSRGLFEESILCFQVGAAKGALLLGYLAFLSELRDRLQSASRPVGFTQSQWEDILRNLRNDDKWEPEITTLANRTNNNPFRIPDDLRNQLAFWRSRRNDCAHAKANEIGIAHVEMLWAFVRSNLPKYVVEGGSQALLSEIEQLLDPSLTSQTDDFAPIISKITLAVPGTETAAFYTRLSELLEIKPRASKQMQERILRFTSQMVASADKSTGVQAKTIVRGWRVPEVLSMVRQHPEVLSHYTDRPQFLRKLWYELLWTDESDMKVFLWILKAGLLPVSDVPDAIATYLESGWRDAPLSEEEWNILQHNGFFSQLTKKVFTDGGLNGYYWSNSKAHAIAELVRRTPLTSEVGQALYSHFGARNYAYDVAARLSELFLSSDAKRQEFEDLLDVDGRTIPKTLLWDPNGE